MACTQSSLKESGILASIGYYTLHAILLSGAIVSTSVLRDLDNLPYVISFWVVAVATCGLYLALRLKDPGFVPYDKIFFTDQDQGPMNSVGNRNVSKSMGSKVELHPHHHHANASIQSDNAESKIVDERISIQSSNREKSIEIEPSLPPSLSDLKLPDKSKSSVNRNNSPGSQEIQCDNISENKNGNIGIHADVVACEPSVEDEEPFDYNPGTITMDENNENDGSVIEEHQRRLQAENSILGTLPNNIEERDNGSGSLNSTKPHDNYNKSVTQFSHDIETEIRHNEHNNPLKELNGNDLIKRQEFFENSCDIQFQTGDDDENKRVNMEEIKSKANRIGEVNVHKRPNHLNKNVILYKLQEKKFCSPKREIENIDVQSVERVITKEKEHEIKDAASVEEGLKQQENRDSTKIEVNESYKNVKEDAGEVFFVERRYCIICNIEQPIRSKHCRTCNKCVARYDHHCPWIGTCIGEKNHQLFFWFIVFQLVELAWADIELIRNIVNDTSYVGPSIGRIILAIILSGFFLFVTSLFVFQTYLIFSNLTTWEKLSWNKITYMKEWDKNWGSPFSKGVKQNLLYFFLKSKKELRRWRLPKFSKDLNSSVKSG